jgi:hypothetical protein
VGQEMLQLYVCIQFFVRLVAFVSIDFFQYILQNKMPRSGSRTVKTNSLQSASLLKPGPSMSATSAPLLTQTEKPGFFANAWAGFGLGTGQAIAHNIFRSDPVQKPSEFEQCMKEKNDMETCKVFLK